jgi:hypothetical protein
MSWPPHTNSLWYKPWQAYQFTKQCLLWPVLVCACLEKTVWFPQLLPLHQIIVFIGRLLVAQHQWSMNTTWNKDSFIDCFIFVDLGWEPTNIWTIRFDFDRPHIFIGDMAYIHQWHRRIYEAQGCCYGPAYICQLIDEYRWDLETGHFLFLSSPHVLHFIRLPATKHAVASARRTITVAASRAAT